MQKMDKEQIEIIERRHVDVISIVLLALFDDYIGYIKSSDGENNNKIVPVISTQDF